jgi:hypothetical protein
MKEGLGSFPSQTVIDLPVNIINLIYLVPLRSHRANFGIRFLRLPSHFFPPRFPYTYTYTQNFVLPCA